VIELETQRVEIDDRHIVEDGNVFDLDRDQNKENILEDLLT
jgi:hypothetical protein